MSLTQWFPFRGASSVRPSRRLSRKRTSIGEVETLEDRCLLATFVVSSLDDNGPGTLRQAVADANASPGLDDIRFDQALLNTSRTIELTGGQITITDSVTILGPSFSPGSIIIVGNDDGVTGLNGRVFEITSTALNVQMRYFTISRGDSSGTGGGLLNEGPSTLLLDMVFSGNAASSGGAIANQNGGGLVMQRNRLIGNSASNDGGAILNISNSSLIMTETTIDSNRSGDDGGGIFNASSANRLEIQSSTLSNNSADGSGGAINDNSTNSSMDAVLIQNSTIAQNFAQFGGGGIRTTSGGFTIINATIANNIDLDSNGSSGGGGFSRTGGGQVMSVNGIVSFNRSSSGNDNINGTQGTVFNAPGSQANTSDDSPRLGPLQNNGGPTLTMLPLNIPGNSVVGTGVTSGTTTLDQRGFGRSASANGNSAPSPDRGAAEVFPTLTQPFIVGPGASPGLGNRAYDAVAAAGNAAAANGVPRYSNQPYDGALFEIRVALADINGDGTKDLVTAPGPGVPTHLRIRNGVNPSQILGEIIETYPGFFGGMFVAAGDINGDGQVDIITGPDVGAGPHVKVFNGADLLGNIIGQPGFQNTIPAMFDIFPYPAFQGGVRVASGDINNDGRADIVTAAGPTGGPHVRVLDVLNPNNIVVLDVFPYGISFTGGVYVATGDVDGFGGDELIFGPGAGGGPHVRVFRFSTGEFIGEHFAYADNFFGGVRVGAVDFNGDRFADIVTGAGPGGGPHVRVINGQVLTTFGQGVDLAGFFAYDTNFLGGVYVAGSSVSAAGGSPLRLAEGFQETFFGPRINDADLDPITAAAIDRLAAAGFDVSGLADVSISVGDLEGDLLGFTFGSTIVIDADAAGVGFFVDLTPDDDFEFQTATGNAIVEAAEGRVDLLTVVAHELAHVLGFPDLDSQAYGDHLLADRLAPGVRKFFEEDDFDALDHAFSPEHLDEIL